MKPLKPKDLMPGVAQTLGLDLSIVEKVVGGYYNWVRKHVSSLDHAYVLIPGLGTFEAKPAPIARRAKGLLDHASKGNTLSETNQKIVNLHEFLVAEAEERKQMRLSRVENRKNNSNVTTPL